MAVSSNKLIKSSFSIENLLAKPYKNGDFVTLTKENIQKFNDFQNNNSDYGLLNNSKKEKSDESALIIKAPVKFDYGPRMHTPDSSCTEENMDMTSDTALEDSGGGCKFFFYF